MLSVSDHGTLLFFPLVLSFSHVFCWLLVCGFSWSLYVGNRPAQLPVSSSSDSTCFPLKGWHWPHNFCCPNWHCQPQAPDTQEICIRIDSCHLTPDKRIIPVPAPVLSPQQRPCFWEWYCDSSSCPSVKPEATFEAAEWGAKGTRSGVHRAWLESLLCHSGAARVISNLWTCLLNHKMGHTRSFHKVIVEIDDIITDKCLGGRTLTKCSLFFIFLFTLSLPAFPGNALFLPFYSIPGANRVWTLLKYILHTNV